MHIHSLPQKSSPLRAGIVAGSVVHVETLPLAASSQVLPLCDAVEFRADALPSCMEELQHAMAACPVPTILTVRSPAEGGIHSLSDPERAQIFHFLLDHAALVDVEIASLDALREVVLACKERGIPVVASFHDFAGTPDRVTLESFTTKAQKAGADAVKFATTLRQSGDLAILAALQESAPLPMATMGMGPLGRISRLLLATMGSVVNYGYLDRPTVPGQWPAQRLRELIRELREESMLPMPHT